MALSVHELVDAILQGDSSRTTVGRLEEALLERHSDSRMFELLTYPLALYNPGGGREHVDAEQLTVLLADLRGDLDRLLAQPAERDV